jgi:hypothetical protein
LGSLISLYKGFARVLDLLFFGFHLPPLVRFSEFFEFSVFRFNEAMKAAARCYLSAIIDIPTVREWALGGGVVIYWKLCRFVVDYLQIV